MIPVCLVCFLCFFITRISSCSKRADNQLSSSQGISDQLFIKHPEWEEDFLIENPYSRPGYKLSGVKNIFVHYVANAGSTAKQNRDYFNGLGQSGERSASSHFIIGLDGEIVQCVPLDEIAYAVAGRNEDSISIECCHPNEDGKFTQKTYESLVELLRWLMEVYDLKPEDVLRHYDSNGKLCPVYYVEHEDEWEELRSAIKSD